MDRAAACEPDGERLVVAVAERDHPPFARVEDGERLGHDGAFDAPAGDGAGDLTVLGDRHRRPRKAGAGPFEVDDPGDGDTGPRDTPSVDLGEEFFVLDGVFSDEHGDYPAGTYVRNPPGSSHAPFTRGGCTIFVKLRQFSPSDTQRVVVDTRTAAFRPGHNPGLTVLPLHEFDVTHTALVRWGNDSRFVAHRHFGGEEVLVLEGTWEDEHGTYPAGTWIRSPHLSTHAPGSSDGCLIYVKVGHLAP